MKPHASRRARWVLAAAVLAVATSLGIGDQPPALGSQVAGAVGASQAQAGADLVAPHFIAESDAATAGSVDGSGAVARDAIAATSDLVAARAWPRIALDPPAAVAPKPASDTAGSHAKPAAASVATAPSTSTSAPAPKTSGVWWSIYHGTSHVWMPTLGIDRHVYLFPCSRSTDPANLVYRWGCAGTNNVYLLGHAYGVFKALNEAYSNGKLKKGMPVVYADASGHVRLYRVTTWRIVSPADAGWAIASQPVPSMTLQTCIGPDGTQRLNVRLVAVSK